MQMVALDLRYPVASFRERIRLCRRSSIFKLECHLITRQSIATHRTRGPCGQTAQHAVWRNRWHSAAMDRCAGPLSESWVVGHEQLPRIGLASTHSAWCPPKRIPMEGERYCLTSDAIAGLGWNSYSFGFGLIVRSAHSRSCRAISMGSAVVTSLAASRSTSCYFSPRANLDVLRRMARALKPGGRILIDHRDRNRDARLPRAVVGPCALRNAGTSGDEVRSARRALVG